VKPAVLPRRAAQAARGNRATPAIDPRHACFRLRVTHSRIQGHGVFAEEPIPAGRKVIEYTGERIARAEIRRRFVRAWLRRGDRHIYLAAINAYWAIDGSVGGSGAEYMNHSCDPNLHCRKIREHLLFFSRRTIRRGEELTLDYGFPKDGPLVPCRCGARNCRGTINLR
jgi:SET domain-containing protein